MLWNVAIKRFHSCIFTQAASRNTERSLFGDSWHPFPFDNASFSIISRLIYCLWGEKLIPPGYAAYCSPFSRFSWGFFFGFHHDGLEGKHSRNGLQRHVLVVIAVCTLIDARKNSWHPNSSGGESTEMDRDREQRCVLIIGLNKRIALSAALLYVWRGPVSLLQHKYTCLHFKYIKSRHWGCSVGKNMYCAEKRKKKALNCLSMFLKDSK